VVLIATSSSWFQDNHPVARRDTPPESGGELPRHSYFHNSGTDFWLCPRSMLANP
jgi:hypothetical protein